MASAPYCSLRPSRARGGAQLAGQGASRSAFPRRVTRSRRRLLPCPIVSAGLFGGVVDAAKAKALVTGAAAEAAETASARLQDSFGGVMGMGAAAMQTDQSTVLGLWRERLLAAAPEEVRLQGEQALAALSAALPDGIGGLAADPGARAGVAAALVALALRQLLVGGDPDDMQRAGMDEWASLAAAEGEEEPEELREYNPKAIREYFSMRPVTLLRRGARSLALLGSFGFSVYLDKKVLGEEPDEKKKAEVDAKRAAELTRLLVCLGPTYVKLGQVLSSRQDLLPAPYITELRTLQDAVPPFDDALAKRIIARELGPEVAGRLSLADSPIASASLGQVYRGVLRGRDGQGDEEVAVKVQRPGALAAISLDVGIIRSLAEPWRKYKGLNTDLEGLVDEWGRRFVAELDYVAEAGNGERFSEAMASRPDLAGVVMAAPVQRDATTRRVLTTGWIRGQRLDTSTAGDIPELCAVALSAYLAMLLDIGLLHADPHPGNLFRTEDGKLCILDWGLVTPVSPSLSSSILQFIAHLVSKDFEKIPADLDAMGFIPSGKREAMEDAGVASALGLLFSALARGGGADGFRDELGLPDKERIKELRKELKDVKDPNERRDRFLAEAGADSKVAQLTRDLEGVQEKYGNIFQIPTYFGYILRSFSVLEGIGLASDPNYSIANECYPYVARRLLTDSSPDSRKALEQLLYGRGGTNLSVKRVRQLAEAFGSYSDITGAPSQQKQLAGAPRGHLQPVAPEKGAGGLSSGAKEALRLAFAPEGGPVQDIALRELARLYGAAVADAAAPILSVASTIAGAAPAPESETERRLRDALLLGGALRATEADQETLRVAEEIRALFLPSPSPSREAFKDTAAAAASATSLPPGFTTIQVPLLGTVPVLAPPLPLPFPFPGQQQQQGPFPGGSLLPPPPPEVDPKVLQELLELAPELGAGAQAAAFRFGSELLSQAADRVAQASERVRETDQGLE